MTPVEVPLSDSGIAMSTITETATGGNTNRMTARQDSSMYCSQRDVDVGESGNVRVLPWNNSDPSCLAVLSDEVAPLASQHHHVSIGLRYSKMNHFGYKTRTATISMGQHGRRYLLGNRLGCHGCEWNTAESCCSLSFAVALSVSSPLASKCERQICRHRDESTKSHKILVAHVDLVLMVKRKSWSRTPGMVSTRAFQWRLTELENSTHTGYLLNR